MVFHQALSTLTMKMPDFQYVILELDKMVLFCIVYMKRLKWIHMKNFWLKKCEKSVTNVRKGKTKERTFLVNDRECFALSYFTFICFFNCQSCKCGCGQLSHNYIKRNLGNPSFSSTTIVMPHFSWINSVVHIFILRL